MTAGLLNAAFAIPMRYNRPTGPWTTPFSASSRPIMLAGTRPTRWAAKRQEYYVLIENIDSEENPKCYLTSVAEDFEIVSEVNHPQVKSLVDFYHEQIAEGNLIEKLERNISKVGLVHIADVPSRHEPGTGEINYPNIYQKLADLNYTQYVAMEFLPIGDPVATLRAARETAIRAVQR